MNQSNYRMPKSPKNQLTILRDTVRNPLKSLLGGPTAKEAEEILREKFQHSDLDMEKLKSI